MQPEALDSQRTPVPALAVPYGDSVRPAARTVDFCGIEIDWDPRVLEPRPWTAAQAEWIADLAGDAPQGPILELCCGAGQIGLVAARLSGRALVQVDQDEVAASYARRNAERAGIPSDVRVASMESALEPSERFPVVVADPPWLPTALVSTFPDDPVTAVDGGADGLGLVLVAARVGLEHLAPAGHLVLQVGNEEQADAIAGGLEHQDDWVGSARATVRERRQCAGGVLVHITRQN